MSFFSKLKKVATNTVKSVAHVADNITSKVANSTGLGSVNKMLVGKGISAQGGVGNALKVADKTAQVTGGNYLTRAVAQPGDAVAHYFGSKLTKVGDNLSDTASNVDDAAGRAGAQFDDFAGKAGGQLLGNTSAGEQTKAITNGAAAQAQAIDAASAAQSKQIQDQLDAQKAQFEQQQYGANLAIQGTMDQRNLAAQLEHLMQGQNQSAPPEAKIDLSLPGDTMDTRRKFQPIRAAGSGASTGPAGGVGIRIG